MNEELKENSELPTQNADRVGHLIAGYISNTLTDAERDELDEWVTASDENMRLFAELTDEKNIAKGLKEHGLYNADKAVELLKARIESRKYKQASKRIRFVAFGIAACVILLAGILLVVPLFEKTNHRQPTPSIVKKDVAPGRDKAILSLSNGKQVVLDSTVGSILQQDHFNVANSKGVISYTGQSNEVAYHTLTVPRGGQYQLVLADGSKVWLNAASSIRFPTAFTGNERKVEIRGEAYFEVAHDASKPFHVLVLRQAQDNNPVDVQVLGTHFNINAYEDEAAITTTLLQGSVNVTIPHGHVLIKPGQQAVVRGGNASTLNVVNDADVDQVTAWKNGQFEFRNQSIEDIMRQVARWYDVDVQYEGKISDHFNATVERDVPVSKLLHYLELTNRVHFVIQDKTIIVKP